jgi:hypothetical protein
MASTVDLQSLLEAAAGERIGRSSDSNVVTLTLIDRAYTKVLVEPDVMEAAAARQLMMREAPINPSA